MNRSAKAQLRGDRLVVSSWSATEGRFPAFVQDDWAECADEPVADEAIGTLVRSALAASRDGVPYPDFRNDPEPSRRRKMLFKMVGVRSETEFARGMRSVSIDWDDTSSEMEIMPYRNGGRRDGFAQMPEMALTVDARAADADLGAAVRRALGVATDGT
jgi:hypothetical protein